ncbi:MAG TPA: hypothetical protein VM778_11040 [Gemmatimonadota bacterium]|nr:hypothetical protein [Gemmatimonadota bacterium]
MRPAEPNGDERAGGGRLWPMLLPLLVIAPASPPDDPAIAIVGVRLLPMDGSRARDGQSVLVEGDRIAWVGPIGRSCPASWTCTCISTGPISTATSPMA